MTTAADVIRIFKKYRGWNSQQIAEELGCSGGFVRATLKRNGLKLPRTVYRVRLKIDADGWVVPRDGTQNRAIYALAKEGKSPTEICAILDIPPNNVYPPLWRMRNPEVRRPRETAAS